MFGVANEGGKVVVVGIGGAEELAVVYTLSVHSFRVANRGSRGPESLCR